MNAVYYDSGSSEVPGKRINSPLGSSLKMVLSLH